jgi:hypothetical protein
MFGLINFNAHNAGDNFCVEQPHFFPPLFVHNAMDVLYFLFILNSQNQNKI